jgi:hypothetical protein
MGKYLFGKSMSTFDCFVLAAISYNYGAGTVTVLEIVGLLIGSALLSGVFTYHFGGGKS